MLQKFVYPPSLKNTLGLIKHMKTLQITFFTYIKTLKMEFYLEIWFLNKKN